MADLFTAVIERLRDIGAFTFLFPYMLTTAIFYGLLRKSQVFGKAEENAAVNAVVAMIAGFMVWAYPIIAGVNIETQLAYFFTQGMIVTLVFIFALLIAGMFLPPDLPKVLSEGIFKGNKQLAVILIGLGFAFLIVITSGLWSSVFGPESINVSNDIFITIVVIIILIVPFLFIMWPTKVEKKEEEKTIR